MSLEFRWEILLAMGLQSSAHGRRSYIRRNTGPQNLSEAPKNLDRVEELLHPACRAAGLVTLSAHSVRPRTMKQGCRM